MNITASISELLFEYECVVLPDFGGFITNDKPARWNRITHQFDPPYKEILFNVQLKANDGLLVKHLAEKESIVYKEAKQQVAAFVSRCRSELEAGKRVEFAQIGSIWFDESQHIVFEQDLQMNYNPDAFGLNSLVSPAIKRTSQEEKIKGMMLTGTKTKKRPDRKPDRSSDEKKSVTKKSIYRFPLAIAGLLVLVILITSVFFPWPSPMVSLAGLFSPSTTGAGTEVKPNQQQLENTKAHEAGFLPAKGTEPKAIEQEQPAEYGNSNETGLAENMDSQTSVEEELVKKTEPVASESENDLAANEAPVENEALPVAETPKPTIDKSAPKIQTTGRRYYVIAGSFSKEENARKLVVQLAEKGYSAMVADTSKNGMYRVAYAGFYKWADAKQELLAIRQEENAEAWVLKK